MLRLSRKEALINEYKGNLFEFLVAKSIAMEFGLEGVFLHKLTDNNLSILNQQEELLRHHADDWVNFLPTHSKLAANTIIKELKIKKLKDINVIGKVNANLGQTEADIILETNDKSFNLSIKLCKNHSFVNTKSAGMRTIFTKYFPGNLGNKIQDEYNQFIDLEFDILARKLHEQADLEFRGDFSLWEKTGQPVLPGELKGLMHETLLSYYQVASEKLYSHFLKIYVSDPLIFEKGILSLMGYSKPDIIQVSSYYRKSKDGLLSDNILISHSPKLNHKPTLKCNKSTMEIIFENITLQVRIKPMNKFTQKAYKINCAVKPLF